MKKTITFLAMFLLVVTGCGDGKQPENQSDDVITVDVTENYSPRKELILQDFMDVEYVALETNDEFVNQGIVLDIGKEIIVVKNRNDDGDIFVYDRTGKALRKINRKGQGSEEYIYISGITLDEDNGEMFVNDNHTRKVLVYDMYGKFKRSFKHREGAYYMCYTDIFNCDRDNLICYDEHHEEIAFILISKQDGRITKEIEIPFKEKKSLQQTRRDGNSTYTIKPGYRTIISFNGNWTLLELSSDTVYSFLPDYSLRPLIVRTPPIQSMNTEIFLMLRMFSDRYFLMETIRNEYNFDTKRGFPGTLVMYDTQEKSLSGYTVYNGDYSTKQGVYLNIGRPVNHEIELWYPLEAFELVESYKKGELKGKLKEVASTLDEEDNPVIMLIKHKK